MNKPIGWAVFRPDPTSLRVLRHVIRRAIPLAPATMATAFPRRGRPRGSNRQQRPPPVPVQTIPVLVHKLLCPVCHQPTDPYVNKRLANGVEFLQCTLCWSSLRKERGMIQSY